MTVLWFRSGIVKKLQYYFRDKSKSMFCLQSQNMNRISGSKSLLICGGIRRDKASRIDPEWAGLKGKLSKTNLHKIIHCKWVYVDQQELAYFSPNQVQRRTVEAEGRGNVMKKTRPTSAFYDIISFMNNLPSLYEIAHSYSAVSCTGYKRALRRLYNGVKM